MIDRDWSQVYELAETYRQRQQWDNAALNFKRAIALNPDFFWSYHHLGDTLTKLQQWDNAAKVYRRAVEIDPSFFWSWHNLGDALTKLQQWDDAIAIYFQALMLESDRQSIYQKLGTVFQQRGSLENSIQYYRRIIQNPQERNIYKTLQIQTEILLKIAKYSIEQHQINVAIVLYYMMLEIQPNLTQVLIELARLIDQKTTLVRDIATRQQNFSSPLIQRQTTKIDKLNTRSKSDISGKIIIQLDRPISAHLLEALCTAVGWSPRPLDKVQKSLDNSFCIVAVWHLQGEKQNLIGFGRAVSDRAFYAVLLDILVHPQFQNRGLGKKIVRTLIERLQSSEINDITLFASPHIADFYHKLGFVSRPNNLNWMLFAHQ